MVVRLKGALIEEISETETARLRSIRIGLKPEGAVLTLELPEALCDTFKTREDVNVIIDDKPIARGESARFYGEGRVFKVNREDNFEVIGTIGGLRLDLHLAKPTPSQKKTFDSERFFIAIL
ncbi:MAG: hypothetical protein DRO73_01250 [Candidatus Thorarchaeota archaeon]|nr:MAG: hypothetical protein DRO73_01250 [Candidatus Thorarchaeota archaeon]